MSRKDPGLIAWHSAIDPPWLHMDPVRIGAVIPTGMGTPAQYLTVGDQDQPVMRVDLYGHSDESYTLTDAIIWQGLLVVGWGHRLYLVDLKTHKVQGHRLGSYFGHLYTHEDVLLVASAEQLFRMEPDGSVAWTTKRLGVDGVLVETIEHGIVEGEGEWDPPGGWRPFRIYLESGLPA